MSWKIECFSSILHIHGKKKIFIEVSYIFHENVSGQGLFFQWKYIWKSVNRSTMSIHHKNSVFTSNEEKRFQIYSKELNYVFKWRVAILSTWCKKKLKIILWMKLCKPIGNKSYWFIFLISSVFVYEQTQKQWSSMKHPVINNLQYVL